MSNFKKIFNFKEFKKTNLNKFLILKKKKNIKLKNDKITIFHLKKKYFNYIKKNLRIRKIFFFMIKKNSKNLFVFNKPKSTLAKRKRK